MYSNEAIKISALPNKYEKYIPENFISPKEVDIKISRTSDELPITYAVDEQIKQIIRNNGNFCLSPFSFNWNQHFQIYTIISRFKKFSEETSLMSMRIDAISRDPYMCKMINYFGSANITVAVEGISDRIRVFLNKSLSDEELYTGITHLLDNGFRSIKMYYIFTGLENEKDLEEFDDFLQRIDELKRGKVKATFDMRLSFTYLLSTLGTPLQYHGSLLTQDNKSAFRVFRKIKALCGRYGFGFRTSSSFGSNEWSQISEFLDGRGQPFIEYCSLNGIYTSDKLSFTFYNNEEKVSKKEYDNLPGSQKVEVDGEFYKINPVDKITFAKLYELYNQDKMFPPHTLHEFVELLKPYHGKRLPAEFLKNIQGSRKQQCLESKVRILANEGDDLMFVYPNGKKQYHSYLNNDLPDACADVMKEVLPVLTGGVTQKDITSDKNGLSILSLHELRNHKTGHIGLLYKDYVEGRSFLYRTYCLGPSNASPWHNPRNTEEIGKGQCLMCSKCLGERVLINCILKTVDSSLNQKFPMEQIYNLFNTGKYDLSVETINGPRLVTNVWKRDSKKVYKINGKAPELSMDHPVLTTLGYKELKDIQVGDYVKRFENGYIVNEKVVDISESEHSNYVYDLEVKNEENDIEKHSFVAEGLIVHNCTSKYQTDSVSKACEGIEYGEKDFHLITDQAAQKNLDTSYKMLVEIMIDDGPYSAMNPTWLKNALYQALFKASDSELIESIISHRYYHTRRDYRIKQDTFKQLISGSLIFELCFNNRVTLTQQYIDKLMSRINDYVTTGWHIENIKLVDKNYLLRNNATHHLVKFRFHSDRVNKITYELLKEKIDLFYNNPKAVLKYKEQVQEAQGVFRINIIDFDKTKVPYMVAKLTSDPRVVELQAMMEIDGCQPLIFLAGFLGLDGEQNSPKSYNGIIGTSIRIIGFYKPPFEKGSILESLERTSNEEKTDESLLCSRCGDLKYINCMTGKPFGYADYEKVSGLTDQFLCHKCFMELSAE